MLCQAATNTWLWEDAVSESVYVAMSGQRFRVDRFWGQLGEGETLGRVSTLAVASDGAVIVTQRSGPPVLVFNPDGSLRTAFKDLPAIDPHGVSVDAQDRILLVDRDAHQIFICSMQGDVIMTLGARHRPQFQAPFNHPTSAAVAGDGDIYVADGYGNATVHRFAPDGTHLATWGQPGTSPGAFTTPHAIWVDQRDRVLVVDRENNRVQLFDRTGRFLDAWHDFYHPMALCEDAAGRIYVSDQIPRLSQLNADGQLIGRCRPVWNMPHGIACAPDGTLYATEMNPNSIVRLARVDD